MAEAGAHLPPWDKHAPHTLSYDQCANIIANNRFRWMKHLKLDAYFWSCLLELDVVNEPSLEEIQVSKVRHDQVFELLNHIEHGPPSYLHGLLRTMVLTDQHHLVPQDIADRQVYLANLDDVNQAESNKEISPKLLKAIADHCKYNAENQMKAHIFAFDGDSGDDFLDISHCHIEITPEVNQTTNSCKKEEQSRRKTIQIPWRKVVEAFAGSSSPKRIRCYGDPGVGKTMFGKYYAYTLSKEFLEKVFMDGKLQWSPDLPKWNTIVVLKARSITTSVEDAIREELGCKHEYVDVLMKHIQDGKGVILNIDGLDELRDEYVLEIIHTYISRQKRKGGPVILITCRTDQSDFDAQLFDRFITLEGFTMQQGIQYAKLYSDNFPNYMAPDPNHIFPLCDFVNEHKEKLEVIITNPLRYYIFCALAMRGEVDLNNCDLNITKLFRLLENHLVKRAGGEVSEENAQAFYKLCLHALLCDIRHFPQELLDHFSINAQYMVFLNRRYTRVDGELEAQYSFSHELILEFMASQYIYNMKVDEQIAMLLWICGDRKLRNVQRIVFEMVMLQGPSQRESLKAMIQCMLVLQVEKYEYSPKSTVHSILGLDKLHTIVHLWNNYRQTITVKELLIEKYQKAQLSQARAIMVKLTKLFVPGSDSLCQAHWYVIANNNGTLDHIIQCLSACTHSYDFLLESTLAQIIPQPVENTGGTCTLRVTGSRDVSITHGENMEVRIMAHSVGDAVNALIQYTTLHLTTKKQSIKLLEFEFHSCQSSDSKKWHQLLKQVAQRWLVSRLSIRVTVEVEIKGLLHQVSEETGLLGIKEMFIHGGTVDMSDVTRCADSCQPAGVTIELQDTKIVLPWEAEGVRVEIMLYKLIFGAGQLYIHGDQGQSVSGLFSELSQCSHYLRGYQEVKVKFGKVDLQAVMQLAHSCKEAETRLELQLTNFVLGHNGTAGRRAVVMVYKLTFDYGRLCIHVGWGQPISGLFSELTQCSHYLRGHQEVKVKFGKVNLQAVKQLTQSCEETGIRLELKKTIIVLEQTEVAGVEEEEVLVWKMTFDGGLVICNSQKIKTTDFPYASCYRKWPFNLWHR